jgi:peptidoglycan/LPS O-acetylase OafA/YrhL
MRLFGSVPAVVRNRTIELDFVRGLAIIAVMGYHFRSVDPGITLVSILEYPLRNFGREGVNLFFTLSGFLVGGLLLRQYAETGHIDAGRFIVRRIFKIWPAYYALILFHVFAGRHPTSTFLVQNLTHMQNYLGTSITQTWSLAVEEHFYLFLPAVLLLFARWRLRADTIIAILAGLCGLVLIARSVAVSKGELDAAFAYTQYRIDSLLFGVILAVIYWMKPDTFRAIARRKRLLIAATVALAAWLVLATKHLALDESIGYTIQAIGFTALIVLVLEYSGKVHGWWIFRAISWIGVYSYGIYLWHSLALAPGELLIRKATALGLPALAIWALALVAQSAIAIGVGFATTRAIEFPFLRLRNALFPAKRLAALPVDVDAPSAGAASPSSSVAPEAVSVIAQEAVSVSVASAEPTSLGPGAQV